MTREDAIQRLRVMQLVTEDPVGKVAIMMAIQELKQPKKTGKWLGASDGYNWYGKCSCCRAEININSWYTPFNYCPKCGTEMEVKP